MASPMAYTVPITCAGLMSWAGQADCALPAQTVHDLRDFYSSGYLRRLTPTVSRSHTHTHSRAGRWTHGLEESTNSAIHTAAQWRTPPLCRRWSNAQSPHRHREQSARAPPRPLGPLMRPSVPNNGSTTSARCRRKHAYSVVGGCQNIQLSPAMRIFDFFGPHSL